MNYQANITLPKELEFLDSEDEERKCREFKDKLIQF